MKIWLDDIRLPPSIEWTHFFTAKDVINALRTVPVDEISLDHDLGLPESIYGTGYDVAVWIEEAAFNRFIPRLTWHIHSQNCVGVKKMRIALENADTFWDSWEAKKDLGIAIEYNTDIINEKEHHE
jgi:hypothetical protein